MIVGLATGWPRMEAAVVFAGANFFRAGFATATGATAFETGLATTLTTAFGAGLAAGFEAAFTAEAFAFGFALGLAGLFLALLFLVLTTEKSVFCPEIRGKTHLPKI